MNNLKNLQLLYQNSCRSKHSIHGCSIRSSLSILRRKSDAITNLGRQQISWLSTIVDSSDFECDTLVDDGKIKKKDTQLHVALTQLASEFGKECRLSLSNFFTPRCASVISTGSLKLDLVLGVGGLPKGRMIEIYGREASGKTTLALHIIKEAQKLGGYCAYLDAENAMDPILAEAMGVNTENLLLSCPDSAENMLNVVDTLTQSGSLDVIVVDSVAALVPQREIDGDIGTCDGRDLSNIMTKALRRIHYSLCRSNTLIVFLNQIRYYANSTRSLGPKGEVTSGGNALGFYAAVRLRTSRIQLLKTNDMPTGIEICVEVVKNKLAPSMKSAELAIQFGKGLRFEPEVLEMALDQGLIVKEGSSYFIEGEVLSSRSAAEKYLAENQEVSERLVTDLRSQLFDRKL
ncbi:DNA repair protein recA homolog 2, mitochondrial isoform X2 [Silene latifolia]|uniref:DNA repair protein recA homolog 2, mitochondrial isoform X2 n=1 Tax=Silene latifolia TaxID=37657 RepID=UPI003D77581D